METPPDRRHRRSVRLRQYDYSQAGVYFITLCTAGRQCLFGDIVDGEMMLNKIGQLTASEWERSMEIRKEIELDAWIIMPNHMHAVFLISHSSSAPAAATLQPSSAPDASIRTMGSIKKSLSSLMQGFKSATTAKINVIRQMPYVPVWQRGLWEHVVRSEAELKRIRDYIAANPQQWDADSNNPAHLR